MKVSIPEELGFSSKRLERISARMRHYVDEGSLPGIITLVARGGEVVHLNKVGWQDVESKVPIAYDTIFRIYSMTKPITSVGLMMLYEHGLFHLYDPVSKFLPEFKNMKVWEGEGKLVDVEGEITIQQLLSHTAGLCYGDDLESPVDALYREAGWNREDITLEESVRIIAALPLVSQPGERWHYSVATDVVGRLIEVISGIPLDQYFEEKIFKPLGMDETCFEIPPEKMDRFATLYAMTEESPLGFLGTEITGAFTTVKNFSGGAGLLSTISDYLRFAQMVLNRGELDGVRLLGKKTMELMTINHLPPELLPMVMGEPWPGFGFGLGFAVLMDNTQAGIMGSVGSHRWGGWASTTFWVDIEEDLLALLMTQLIPIETHPVGNDLRTLVYQALVD
jgi:CubicO group peptidase (beta-lactamase class C family)